VRFLCIPFVKSTDAGKTFKTMILSTRDNKGHMVDQNT